MILSLYQLQAFYLNEIYRGIAGLEEYSIASAYSYIEVQTLAHLSTYSPEEIVMRLRDGVMGDALSKSKAADTTVKSQHEDNERQISK